MQTEEQRKKRKKTLKIVGALIGVLLLVSCCAIGGLTFLGSEPTAALVPTVAATTTYDWPEPETVGPTSTPQPTPIPTVVAVLEGVYAPGTYIVGVDLQSGTYRGQAETDVLGSCYWARLKDLTGELGSIIANDNAVGQFYIEVKESDFALETACRIERMSD